MKRKESKVCPQCEKEICDDADECRIEWMAEREQDFKDFVADMEEAMIEAKISDTTIEVRRNG